MLVKRFDRDADGVPFLAALAHVGGVVDETDGQHGVPAVIKLKDFVKKCIGRLRLAPE